MPVPSSISDLSTTPSLNSPAGTESPSTVDDYLRTFAAFIKQVDGGAVKAADLAAPGGSALVGFQQAGAGATERTAQDKLREIVSVKDFGAVGDGVADDSAAIQAAINHIESTGYYIEGLINAYGGVFFPDGEYKATGLVVTKPITLFGNNRATACLSTSADATLLTIDTSTFTTPSGLDLNYQGPTIRGLGFKGSLSGANQNGIVLKGKPGVYRVDSCNIQYFGNIGAHAIGVASLIFTNNQVQQNFYNAGLMVDGNGFAPSGYITYSEISGNLFRRNNIGADLRGIISTTKFTGNLVESNTQGTGNIGSATRPGIGLKLTKTVGGTGFQAFTDGVIRDNYFEFHWNNIYVEGMADSVVSDNYIDGNQGVFTTYSVEASPVTPFGPVIFKSNEPILNNLVERNKIPLLEVVVPTGSWSVVDGTTIAVSSSVTNFARLSRFADGGYVVNGTANIVYPVTAYSIPGDIHFTVASTASFVAGQPLTFFVPQVSGASGTPYANRFVSNLATLPSGYVDPEGVNDGQCIPTGARSVREGISSLQAYGFKGSVTAYGEITYRTAYPTIRLEKSTPTLDDSTFLRITGSSVSNSNPAHRFVTSAGGVANQNAEINKNGDYTASALNTTSGGAGLARGGYAYQTPAGLVYHYYGSAAPTAGTYAKNSVVWNTNMAAGNRIFWVCTAGGTPGTWVSGPIL